MKTVNVAEKQAPLRTNYRRTPANAMVIDMATTQGDPTDPFHAMVEPMPGGGFTVPVGVHRAVGGPHDAPTPGDMLCAALAACQDSTLRMVANLLGVELEALEVKVSAEVDVRGTLMVEPEVPVGFQSVKCEVRLRAREGTSVKLLERLYQAARHCCVVQQTLINPPRVHTEFKLG